MNAKPHSPEWLIANADHGVAFERACASAMERLLTENANLQQQLEAIGAGGVGPLIPTAVQHQHDFSSKNDLQRKTGDSITSCSTTPADWKWVPVKPTESMLDAGGDAGDGHDWSGPEAVYLAMLNAVPQPPAGKDQNWPKLEKPARVGGGTFGIGTSSRHVVDAAQRAHDEHIRSGKLTHEQMVEEERKRRALWDMINGSPEAPKPPFVWQPQSAQQLKSKDRQAFDEWCRSVGLVRQSHGIMSISSHTDTAWIAWQAAISTRQQPQDEQEPGVLMPSRSLVDQVIRELTRYCNTGEMDDAESLLANLQFSIDPAQQPPQELKA